MSGFFKSRKEAENEQNLNQAAWDKMNEQEARAKEVEQMGRNALAVQQEQSRGARIVEMIKASSGENRQFYNTPVQNGQTSVETIRGTDRNEDRFRQMAGGEWALVPKTSVLELKQGTDQQRANQAFSLGNERNAIDRLQAVNTGKYQEGQNKIGEQNATTNEQFRKDQIEAMKGKPVVVKNADGSQEVMIPDGQGRYTKAGGDNVGSFISSLAGPRTQPGQPPVQQNQPLQSSHQRTWDDTGELTKAPPRSKYLAPPPPSANSIDDSIPPKITGPSDATPFEGFNQANDWRKRMRKRNQDFSNIINSR